MRRIGMFWPPLFVVARMRSFSNNKKHFPADILEPYEMECITADEFLEHQYHLNPDLFICKLTEQASDIDWTLHQLISKHVPSLARLITPPTA
jgi:hypothetical protein